MILLDLTKIIFSYLPLTTLQLLDDSGYGINVTNLVKVDKDSILTPFERYCRIRMLKGEIGYNGQFYLPVYACLFNCIKTNNLDLFNYYLLRFIGAKLDRSLKAIFWAHGSLSLLLVMNFLFNKYATTNMFKDRFDTRINSSVEGKQALDQYQNYFEPRPYEALAQIEPEFLDEEVFPILLISTL